MKSDRTGLRRFWRLLGTGCLLFIMSACDFGGGGGGAGCIRVAQGDFEFPAKRVINGAVEVRVTQRGFDRLTERVRELVLAFFGADANGRAIIPLSSLGLGSIGTGFGPLSATVRDLVLTLDLSSLSVTLVANSNPARLNVSIRDAEIGLVDGAVAGSVSGFLFSGDLACALRNGPSDRVALLDLDLAFTIRMLDNGTIDLRVLPSSFDIQQFSLTVATDCNLPECLDGLPPGSTSECNECESLCPTGDFLATLVSSLRDAFDDVFDSILSSLGDEVANLVLGLFVNNRPLAVEGLLPIGNVLGPVLGWMRSARPLAVFVKPAANGIRVSGAADGLGLDLVFDAGFDANTHPCVGPTGPDPEYRPGPRPGFDGFAETPDGARVPYDVAFGVSDAVVNAAIHAAWKSGALCIVATSDDIARLTQGGLRVGASTLDLLLPGYASLVGADAPVRLAVFPRFDLEPEPVRFGRRDDVEVVFVAAEIGVDARIGNGWLRVLTMQADLALGVDVSPTADARLEIRLGAVALDNLEAPDNVLFGDAKIDVIAPFVVDLALGFLAERPISFDLGTSGLLSGLGVSLAPVVVAIGPVGPERDWLGVHLALEPTATVSGALAASRETAPSAIGGRDDDGPFVTLTMPESGADAWRVRPIGGLWSATLVGPGPHRFTHPRFETTLGVTLELRPDRAGTPSMLVEVVIPPAVSETITAPETQAVEGCGSSSGSPVLLLFIVSGIWFAARRRARQSVPWLGLWLALSAVPVVETGCNNNQVPPPRICQSHDQCDDAFHCAESGRCEPASACASDNACCPGSVCFSGWCRPTDACSDTRPCAGFDDVCEDGQCVPAGCDGDNACRPGARCVGGRCLVGAPCRGICSSDEVCDVASGRCLGADHCGPVECNDGWVVADWNGATPHPMYCEGRAGCVCAAAPAPLPALPGIDPVIGATISGPIILSYDERGADLVMTRTDGSGVIVDGDARASSGIAVDGAVGRGVVIAKATTAGSTVDVLYQDIDARNLVYGRVDAASGALLTRAALPIDGESGRFQCLVNVATGAGRRLVGWAFVASARGDSVSRLVRLDALVEDPVAPSDWRVTTVVETPLPSRSERPCDGACGLGEVCVLASGAERCALPALIAPPACAACDARQACASLRDTGAADEAATCHFRVEPETRPGDGRSARGGPDGPLPFGAGLFVSCAVDANAPGGPIVHVAYQDADKRRIVVTSERLDGVEINREVIAPGDGGEPGHHIDLAVLPDGRKVMVFQDAATESVMLAETASRDGAWQTRTIERGGTWAKLVTTPAGDVRIVHGDGRRGELRLAARWGGSGGCWSSTVIGEAASGWATALDGGLEGIWIGRRALAFAGPASPAHRLIVSRVEPPRCTP